MRNVPFFLLIACAATLGACKDSDNGGTTDVGDDASDVGVDGDAEAEVDGNDDPDADATEDTDAGPELDGEDDVAVDTDDTDDATDGSGWPHEYPEPECLAATDCDEGSGCVGGGCVAPIDPDTFVPTGEAIYLHDIYLPSTTDEPCCFDLDGDGNIDNTAGDLIAAWDALADASGSIRGQLEKRLAIGPRFFVATIDGLDDDLNGPATLAIWSADNDVDSDGTVDQTAAERAAGEGRFQIDRRGVGNFGAFLQFPGAQFIEGALQTTQAPFDGDLPLGGSCTFRFHGAEPDEFGARCLQEGTVGLRIGAMRLQGQFERREAGLFSVDTTTGEGSGEQVLGGVEMGGYLHMDMVVEALNASYIDNCACAGFTVDAPAFVGTLDDSELTYSCRIEGAELARAIEGCLEAQSQCTGIQQICDSLGFFSTLAEYDSDGDSIDDSISIGARFAFAPAEIVEGSEFLPHPEDCRILETPVDDDGDGLIDCEDPDCWDDTNCGALGHSELCRNGWDDEGDGFIDCEDSQCRNNRSCIDEGSGAP